MMCMLSFSLDNDLNKRLLTLHARCAVAWTALRQAATKDELEYLRRAVRVSVVGASTRIESAVLTDPEIAQLDTDLSGRQHPTVPEVRKYLVDQKMSQDRERSLEEVAGCREMILLLYEQGPEWVPLHESTLCGLHRTLLEFYPAAQAYRGQYKSQPNSVVERNHQTGEEHAVLRTAPPGPITVTAMHELLQWYNATIREDPWAIAVASEFVFRFLAIHPFQDGNGRLGRGLFSLALMQAADPHLAALVPYLAIDRAIEQHKHEYYTVLQQCSGGQFSSDPQQYRLEYFARFMVKMVGLALANLQELRERYQAFQRLSEAALAVLNCFHHHPERRLQTKAVCDATHLPRRTVSRTLSHLVRAGFLQQRGQGPARRYQLVF